MLWMWAIEAYLNANNASPKPFVWTAAADVILAKVRRGQVALSQLQAETDSANYILSGGNSRAQSPIAVELRPGAKGLSAHSGEHADA